MVDALCQVSFEVQPGETLCLVGASGSGKTTALRLVNRMVEPSAGRVFVDGVDVARQDPVALRRRTGYVVQRGGLFPHLSVAGNVGLLARLDGWDSARIASRVATLLELVQLEPATFRDRFPHQLSGGQRQRVGVARALMLDPPVLLMDEPFGALDPATRNELQAEFAQLTRVGRPRTTLLVTHDLAEARRLGDRIAVLAAGRLVQIGTPAELADGPTSIATTAFFGSDSMEVGGAG